MVKNDFIYSLQLWDIRRKGCIYTYKGHTNSVNSLKFSPDGKWIATGGEDGLVKVCSYCSNFVILRIWVRSQESAHEMVCSLPVA